MINLLLKEIAEKKNLSIQGDASLMDLIKLMNANHKGVVIILKNNQPTGILTEKDVVRILHEGIDLYERADKHSKKTVVSTQGDRTVGYALNLTIDNKIRRVVVTDTNNNFIGLVTQQDLLKYVEEDFYRLTIKVKHILKESRKLISVSPVDSLSTVLKVMIENNISAIAVLQDNIAVGIITEKDILQLAADNIPIQNKVGAYMSNPLDTAHPDTPLVEIVEVMNLKNIRRVLIVDKNDLPLTIITIRDVVKNLEGDYSKFLERKLNNAKQILNLLPEMMIEVVDTGKEQLVVWANNKAINMFGNNIIDKPVMNFLPKKNWDYIYITLMTVNKIENIKFKKGDRIYELSGFFLKTDGGGAEKGRFQLIMRDITEEIRMSTVDTLTNIYNKRFINEFLIKEIERSKRLDNRFSIVICDMDDFKKINDTLGHLSGDMVLKSFSELIAQMIRSQDVVGRYGGDEFMLILPETDRETALHIIDRLRDNIEKMEVSVLKNKKAKITASFGIATFPEDGTSSDDLLIASDERLYKAKSLGKNTVAN
ncbi:diguanylate cyclase DosC [bacterium BMS3Bbin09]|nr:diguanylate cyclase DosC [bacterium BMS3Bbin09]